MNPSIKRSASSYVIVSAPYSVRASQPRTRVRRHLLGAVTAVLLGFFLAAPASASPTDAAALAAGCARVSQLEAKKDDLVKRDRRKARLAADLLEQSGAPGGEVVAVGLRAKRLTRLQRAVAVAQVWCGGAITVEDVPNVPGV